MENQNYKNHRKFVPLYHFALFIIILCCLAAACYNLYKAFHAGHERLNADIETGLCIALLLTAHFARTFALKAQDRALRAEENFRHFVLTGKPLDNRLTLSQVIALRFTGDNEFVTSAQRAARENLTAGDIKKDIVNWRGDYHRI